MTGWNFAAKVWISFDPPSSTSPTWVDISGFVETDSPLGITHGRGDGLSDVNATTVSLTVDNSDGRFSPANPAGAWFGQIHKGNWLKVEITPSSSTVSSRFVGFTTSLPNQWTGQYQTGQISASDRFEKLGQSPAIVSSIQSEVLTDPDLAPGNPTGSSVQAYYNLHEPQGATSFGDTSGSLARYLSMASIGGVPPGIGIGASNVPGPGFDGLQAVTFNPPITSQGTYLTAPIATPVGTWSAGPTYTGLVGVLSFWYQATSTAAGMIISVVDPISQFAFTAFQEPGAPFDRNLQVGFTSTSQRNLAGSLIAIAPTDITDGDWHHIVLAVAATSSLGGVATATIYIDGLIEQAGEVTMANAGGNFTQLIIGGGYNPSFPGTFSLGAGNISDVSWYWGSALQFIGSVTYPPDVSSHFLAGFTGFSGESADQRIARVARYAKVPIPLAPVFDFPYTGDTVQRYNPIKGPWTNLSTAAHAVSAQSMAGRKPLDIMLEAAHTENSPLYVDRSGYLALQPSTTRQNTTPAWTVNALDLDPGTQVADDFAYFTNQITVTPNSQAAQTVIGGAGSAGQASQAKYGVYDGSQSTASVNPTEAQSLGLGIIQLRADPPPRLAPLVIEASTLALLPGYGNAWYDAVLATEISTPIRVTNAPAAIGGGSFDCFVEGWTETITAGQHVLAFNTSVIQGPTYQLDDAVLGRLDTDGTALVGALNTTATTFTAAVATPTSAAWTVAAADFPFDILMGTEQMTVTSIAAVALGVDGTFETSATGWTLTNCTLAQSSAQAHTGTKSGLMTASAAGFMSATTPQFAVLGGATYLVSQWFLLGTGAPSSETAAVQWFTSGGGSLGQVILPYLLTPQATWRQQQQALTAPPTAAFATVRIGVTAAATGNTMFIDDVTFTLLTGGQQVFTVTRSVNSVVASHTTGAALALAEPLTLAY